MRLVAVALPLVVLLGACAEQPDPSNGGNETAGTTVDEPRYEATTMVLEDADGPQLCLGGVMESLPPQCGGIPVEDWNWADVDGEESVRGVTWGEFHVMGTFDGTAVHAARRRTSEACCGRGRRWVRGSVPRAARRVGGCRPVDDRRE